MIEYMQNIKSRVDELATMNAPIDNEDLTIKILNGLGDEFKDLVTTIQTRENPISFEELHEKLINFEAYLKLEAQKSSCLLTTTNFANKPTHGRRLHSNSPSYYHT